jgi:hypothetical protein
MADLVRVKMDDGAEASVGREFAEVHGLKVLNKPAADSAGRGFVVKYPVTLAGSDLDDALEAAGLPKSGTAAEKRKRLDAFNESTITPTGGTESAPAS